MSWLDRLRCRPAPPPLGPMEEALAAFQAGDYARALDLWEPLARAGSARAQANIGACFAEGMGVPVNPPLALKWLTLAAEAGHAAGQRNLAALYLRGGEGVEPDFVRAAELYRLAAEQGDALAQDMLSWMLLEGEVMPSDPEEARRWALAAAEAGVASSMTRLGMLYHHAMGVERDVAEAARWWRMAAERGDADGQAMLGAAHHLGAGVGRDGVTALAWLIRASRGGSTLAQPFLPAVRASLDPGQMAEAEHRAAAPLEAFSP
ncbi:tetratricopeptide repeat protein [Roseomonas sp. SXEYE001]|uniref:tetratricopeptide repeat protein n=2 Tax=Roseomonas xinghualingensis TaxID=2986475 RepID=UPI0021F1528B|nr:tetratricopeptide repeat protein [Roseomonas sp. SXEYE001]MCV4209436.1 sel1 repeat family protein [Roseomonas sp. SXEYE001]